jgi:uncharacterized membrane protein (UPF0127 family)
MKLRIPVLCIFLAHAAHGCSGDADTERGGNGGADTAPAPMSPASFNFDSALVRIETAGDTHQVHVEVAEREEQRAFGLMERTSLAEDAGMVFLYNDPQPGTSGYWMYRTRIPLDIAFFDGAGRIVAILQMEPCPSSVPEQCRIAASGYSPGKPYTGALEVNRGYFAQHNVQVGDRLTVVRRQ